MLNIPHYHAPLLNCTLDIPDKITPSLKKDNLFSSSVQLVSSNNKCGDDKTCTHHSPKLNCTQGIHDEITPKLQKDNLFHVGHKIKCYFKLPERNK